jgi:steroid 5-alpha reductase family enzyme
MPYYLQTGLLIFIYMVLVFLIALIRKDNSIVDIFWGLGFIVVAGYSFMYSGNYGLLQMIMNLLVLLWGLRLTFYIFFRNRGKGEDFRYKAWRDTWKYFVLRSFFQIFMLQGLFMFLVALPIVFVNRMAASGMDGFSTAGTILFLAGFLFETIGDYQLVRFKKDPGNKGKIITTGLWKITRHPNYFGEALLWWGIAFFAAGYPGGWMTLISPILITLLLRFVSGVPMLEKKYRGRPDWEEYKRKTPPFVPFLRFL